MRFFIKLKSDDYSFVAKRMQSAFGGTSTLPRPEVANECACCDAATERMQPIRVSAYRGHVDKPLEVPVCEHCSAHVNAPLGGVELVLALGAGIFAIGIVLGFVGSLPWLWLASLALFGIFTVLLWRRSGRTRAEHNALLAAGHSPGLIVTAEPYTLTLVTRNRRFARTLLDVNPSAVLDHPHERFLYEPAPASKPASVPIERQGDETPRMLT